MFYWDQLFQLQAEASHGLSLLIEYFLHVNVEIVCYYMYIELCILCSCSMERHGLGQD